MEDDFDDFNLEEIVEYDSTREKIEMILDDYELTELINLLEYLESEKATEFDSARLLS